MATTRLERLLRKIQAEAAEGRRIVAVVIENVSCDQKLQNLMQLCLDKGLDVLQNSDTINVLNLSQFSASSMGCTCFLSTTKEMPAVHEMVDNIQISIDAEFVSKAPADVRDARGSIIVARGVTVTSSLKQTMKSSGKQFPSR